jgi:GDP-L-fucose synthase
MRKDYNTLLVNIGIGKDITIGELAEAACLAIGEDGELEFDNIKADRMKKKLLSVARPKKSRWAGCVQMFEGACDSCKDFVN